MAGSWSCSAAPDEWDAKVRDAGSRRGFGAVERDELGAGGVEADLESFDFAEPAVHAGLGDAVAEVADDRDEAGPLLWVDAHHGAPDVPLTEIVGRFSGIPEING